MGTVMVGRLQEQEQVLPGLLMLQLRPAASRSRVMRKREGLRMWLGVKTSKQLLLRLAVARSQRWC